ncbi:unnamed protein product [Allacma fusca]|uniref:Acetyl-coenzyme A transporter 1 n=1 Tax=Allacma fusca TaxID=39272 RepID=A0A8J2PQS3_9HEXA|nr:unnamed protein product [Allacma fusca]
MTKANFRKDLGNIFLLVFLYVLQGIPLGLIASIPMILQNRSVSYKEQAKFSFAIWPFSLKLFWAPIVDALYSSRMGRRKTWLVPMQYLIGIFMLTLSPRVNELLDTGNIGLITGVFFMLNFLAATQDIAVDGWALTMLRKENVGYASTCNSVGQTAGYFLGFVVFLALESADFCNNYLRSAGESQTYGMVTLPGFLNFWAWVFIATTTLVWIMKREKPERGVSSEKIDVISSYKGLWQILQLPNIRLTLVFLLSCKIAFAAADSVTGLKFVEMGVPKDRLALLAIPMTPLQILLPVIISRYTAGPNPMNVFIKAYPFRLVYGLVFALVVYFTPSFKLADGTFPFIYYAGIVVIYAIHQVAVYSMFVAVMAFFAQVSDPTVGGTYMTLLNTVCNMGGNWPSTLVLWLVDPLTSKSCTGGTVSNDCSSTDLKEECTKAGGKCSVDVDGYYIMIPLNHHGSLIVLGYFILNAGIVTITCFWFDEQTTH